MSIPSISCPKCGNPMPANYAWCPSCGHANAFVSPDSAVTPPEPRPNAEGTEAVSGQGQETQTLGTTSDSTGGAPTVNVGGASDQALYTPPPEAAAGAAGASAAAWQPGQYNNAPLQAGQPPAPMPPQGQYMPAQQYTPPPAPPYGQPPQPYPYAANPPKDPTVALLLELIGYAGFLGIGHIYAGRTGRGIALLLGGWAYLVISGVLTILCIGFFMLMAWLVVPVLSGLWIKSDVERDNAMRRF